MFTLLRAGTVNILSNYTDPSFGVATATTTTAYNYGLFVRVDPNIMLPGYINVDGTGTLPTGTTSFQLMLLHIPPFSINNANEF